MEHPAESIPPPPPEGALADLPFTAEETALMARFESLGATPEFGVAQRRYGAEPAGLLRWSAIGLADLTAMIAAGFEGLGDPADTDLILGPRDEYSVRSRRYGLAMHTFLSSVEGQPAERSTLHVKQSGRMKFLGRKLLRELAAGDRLFVQHAPGGAAMEDVFRLHRAMLAHGRNTLLHVRLAESPDSAGSVIQVGPRLYVGRIGHFVGSGRDWRAAAFETWHRLCATVAFESRFET